MNGESTIRALVLRSEGELVVEEIPAPRPGRGEVLLDVLAAGICGSDIHGYAGETGRRSAGMVMGHEISARIAEPGADVDGWNVGDLVTVNPVIGCDSCRACTAGQTNRCPRLSIIGVTPQLPGAFAEQLVAPAANLYRIKHNHPTSPAAALVEPLAVGLNAAKQARVGPGRSVAVIGLGMIGMACVWGALREGAAVVYAGDIDRTRGKAAERLGEPGRVHAFDLSANTFTEHLVTDGIGRVDAAIDAVGLAVTCAEALNITRAGGTVSLVGMGVPTLDLAAYQLTTNELSINGSFCYPTDTFTECVRTIEAGEVDPSAFIDHVISLDQAADMFRDLASGRHPSAKAVIVPTP